MVDREGFRQAHPEFCDPAKIRVPGLDPPRVEGGKAVEDWRRVLAALEIPPLPPERPSFKPTAKGGSQGPTLRDVLGRGNDGAAHYLSFRLDPGRWGVHLSRSALEVMTGEIQRVVVRGFPEARAAPPDTLGELAFHLAYDYALGHAKFHAAVDDFAAEKELALGRELYGPYLQGPYLRSLGAAAPNFNLEEALANVVALRIFLNPSALLELGHGVEKAINEDDAFRWNSYLMSTLVASEFIFLLRVLPPGYRDFLAFLGNRTEVTAYAHMSIQYNVDQQAFGKGLSRLAAQILAQPEAPEGEGQALLRAIQVPQYLY
jgi:hypothetical protein